jgi:thiol:disulfide interchange protein
MQKKLIGLILAVMLSACSTQQPASAPSQTAEKLSPSLVQAVPTQVAEKLSPPAVQAAPTQAAEKLSPPVVQAVSSQNTQPSQSVTSAGAQKVSAKPVFIDFYAEW